MISDNRGRTWFCVCCNAVFFIPELILKAQREVGCPICTKRKWRKVSYECLFIKDTSKLKRYKRLSMKNEKECLEIKKGVVENA